MRRVTGDMILKARHDIRDLMQETGDVRQKKRKVIRETEELRRERLVQGGCETAFFKFRETRNFEEIFFEFRENKIVNFREPPNKFSKIPN